MPRRGAGAEERRRTAHLLLDGEIGGAAGDDADPRITRMAAELRDARAPRPRVRRLQRALLRLGALDWSRSIERPLLTARRAALGDAAPAPPRFLVRVDEFPNYLAFDAEGEYGVRAYRRFHELMRDAGVPYLVAVLPFVSFDPLDPRGQRSRPLTSDEQATLRMLADEGVALALHGRDHRTRFASPRRHSELCGLDASDTCRLLDESLSELELLGIEPRVFVAPYNRFDAGQLPLLAQRFEVVCGGPESVGRLGLHSTPQWWGRCVYLPSYPPFYGRASEILPAAAEAIERQTGLWLPLTLHWEWEQRDSFRSLGRLADLIAPYTASWDHFSEAVRRSAKVGGAASADAKARAGS